AVLSDASDAARSRTRLADFGLVCQDHQPLPELSATLSSAPGSGSSWGSGKTKPKAANRVRERAASEASESTALLKTTWPEVGVSTPDMQCKSVDLPEPDGPMTATVSPALISRVMPDRTGAPPKSLVTSSRCNMFAVLFSMLLIS